MDDTIKTGLTESLSVVQHLVDDPSVQQRVDEVAALMTACLKQGGCIYFCGNGGSAADAQHLAAELSGRFNFERDPLSAEALHCNTSYLTAVANDYGYEFVYSRMIEGRAKPGDVLVGITTSGNSRNVCLALQAGRQRGMKTVAMTGRSGGQAAQYADVLLNVPSDQTPRIQEAHILLGHLFCASVERAMFPSLKATK